MGGPQMRYLIGRPVARVLVAAMHRARLRVPTGAAVAVVAVSALAAAPGTASADPVGATSKLANIATGRCLDDSTAFGKDVLRGYPCLQGNDYQRWERRYV